MINQVKKTTQDKLKTKYVVVGAPSPLAIKDIDQGSRTVTGYFNAFDYVDHDLDVIRKGSFLKSIQERGPESSGKAKIKHLLFHDFTKIVGKPNVLTEDEKGLYFETRLPDTQDGNDTLIKYADGIYDNHSIGFSYVPGKIRMIEESSEDFEKALATVKNPEVIMEMGYFYDVTEVKLYEGSVVGIGANESTPFLGIKSGDSEEMKITKAYDRLDKIVRHLQHGKSSDACMLDFEAQVSQLKEFIRNLVQSKGVADLKNHSNGAGEEDTTSRKKQLLAYLT